MLKVWSDDAWDDYLWWQAQDRKTLRRINALVKDIESNGAAEGIGRPEPLAGELSGFWSRRINEKDRLVYRVSGGTLQIASCRGHYGDH